MRIPVGQPYVDQLKAYLQAGLRSMGAHIRSLISERPPPRILQGTQHFPDVSHGKHVYHRLLCIANASHMEEAYL